MEPDRPCMLLYNKKTDTLSNDDIPNDKLCLFKYMYGDFLYAEKPWGTYLVGVKNASKYIKRDILEEMTEDHDYIVYVDRRYEGDLFQVPKFIKNVPKITYYVDVYKKVVRTVPTLERELVSERRVVDQDQNITPQYKPHKFKRSGYYKPTSQE